MNVPLAFRATSEEDACKQALRWAAAEPQVVGYKVLSCEPQTPLIPGSDALWRVEMELQVAIDQGTLWGEPA